MQSCSYLNKLEIEKYAFSKWERYSTTKSLHLWRFVFTFLVTFLCTFYLCTISHNIHLLQFCNYFSSCGVWYYLVDFSRLKKSQLDGKSLLCASIRHYSNNFLPLWDVKIQNLRMWHNFPRESHFEATFKSLFLLNSLLTDVVRVCQRIATFFPFLCSSTKFFFAFCVHDRLCVCVVDNFLAV